MRGGGGGGGGGRRWREEVEGGGAPLTPPMVHHHPLEVGHLWLSYVHLFLFNPNLGRLQLPIVLNLQQTESLIVKYVAYSFLVGVLCTGP